MTANPKIGRYRDDEEADFIESFENSPAPLVGDLTPERRAEIVAMARATMVDEREKIRCAFPNVT